MKKGYRELLDEANAEIEVVSPDQAAALLDDDEIIFVDLRDQREVERDGRIPGAKHVPRGMLEFWIDPESPYHKPFFASGKSFVFFCAGGWRSALATKTAQDMGLEPARHILGGFTAWKAMLIWTSLPSIFDRAKAMRASVFSGGREIRLTRSNMLPAVKARAGALGSTETRRPCLSARLIRFSSGFGSSGPSFFVCLPPDSATRPMPGTSMPFSAALPVTVVASTKGISA